ncbi:MAG: NAD(P)H-hydrate dehydratase [Gaiellales bacterium]|nr:NAD(P)H-hydrate dehydratase [Gaiellales bacterium]
MKASLTRLFNAEDKPGALTAEQMRALDEAAIQGVGIPGPVLMERAALGVSELVLSRYQGRHTLIVCGRGNNGGDGLAAARQLHLVGHPVVCVVLAESAEQLSADARLNLNAARQVGVNLRMGSVPDYLLEEAEVVLDCLLGTGAAGEMREPLRGWARAINGLGARGVPVVAVDVPSGVNASSGGVAEDAVAASCTVTFGALKTGLVVPPGSEAAGEVLVWDIGLPPALYPAPDVNVVTGPEVVVPGRRPDDHKYRAGYVAVLAGSGSYPGAALLAARAAARCGAGYVRLLAPASVVDGLRRELMEVTAEATEVGSHLADAQSAERLTADPRISSLVVGPGVGRAPETQQAVRAVVMAAHAPVVLDADGLLAFAGRAVDLERAPSPLVLTPHVGELASLLTLPVDEVARCPLAAARGAAELTGQTVLLKGSSTIIAVRGGAWVVAQGPPQLASAGTGDVLSGCIGALLAKGLGAREAASSGAWLHAEAARLAVPAYPAGLMAADLIDALPAVLAPHVQDRRPSWTR